jgi:hypothetical protein
MDQKISESYPSFLRVEEGDDSGKMVKSLNFDNIKP